MDFNGILASAIQGVREISVIIVTDNYVIRNQKSLQFFSYFDI